MNQPPVILFDGICNLCCGWVQFLIHKDKRTKFRFATLQSESGKMLMDSLGLKNGNMETIIYIKGNHFFQESSAVLEILHDTGGIWRMLIIFKLIPKSIRNNIYQIMAKRRYTFFGIRGSCYLPTEEEHKRFLP